MIDQGNDRIIATFDSDSGLRDARDLLMASGFADTDIRWVTTDQPIAVTSENPRIGEDVSMTDAKRRKSEDSRSKVAGFVPIPLLSLK